MSNAQRIDFSGVIAAARRAASQSFAAPPEPQRLDVDKALLEAFRATRGGRVNDPVIRGWVTRWEWGSGGALLLGPSGIGKTTGALAVARRMLQAASRGDSDARRRAESIRFVTAYDAAAAQPDTLERLKLARLLIVDDMGWEDTYRSKLPELIHARAIHRFPTVVTSGMRAEELAERYGAALTRRIVSVPAQGDIIDPRAKVAPRRGMKHG